MRPLKRIGIGALVIGAGLSVPYGRLLNLATSGGEMRRLARRRPLPVLPRESPRLAA